ncbi:MAG: hypothetical protein DRN18_02650 [Thermoplasmata archaeon]|nr:MAG: hypothetical protein DRN18_02650 [Thermoplasmata archaeon]
MEREVYKLSKEDFYAFVGRIMKDFETIGVVEKRGNFVFSKLEKPEELRLDYDITILPPKVFFLPPYEKMMEFDLKEQKTSIQGEETGRVIIGVHPYDVIALKQMDEVYLKDTPDDLYRNRRENTIIVASDIINVSEYSFASSLGTHVVNDGFDLLLTELDGKVFIEIGSEKGEGLLRAYAKNIEIADDRDIRKIKEHREKLPERYKLRIEIEKDQIPFLLMDVYGHPLWEEESRKCLQCGSCTIVCPTCYCYDVRDEVSLTLENGERIRTWDSCLLPDFTKIASGETFRDKAERFRHRIYRKGLYIPLRYNFIACVGCGRCIKACIPKVANPVNIINTLVKRRDESKGKLVYQIPEGVEVEANLLPEFAVIRRVEALTESEKLFELEMINRERFDFQPGQFVEVSIFGVGEAPISISSPPSEDNRFELVVRRVGSVTGKLHSMREGDKIGIRGPLGRGFNVNEMEGKDLLFVAGGIGIVPLRSLIKHVLSKDNRSRFGKIFILYGSRTPKDVLFMNEINEWEKERDVEIKLSVDTCPEGMEWDGKIGVVTTLFSEIEIEDPKNTVATVVGPPVMYKFVLRCLKDIGIEDRDIFVSLERRMKCGIGKCGHCQINGVYVCKEGPVFRYSEIKDLPEAFS